MMMLSLKLQPCCFLCDYITFLSNGEEVKNLCQHENAFIIDNPYKEVCTYFELNKKLVGEVEECN